MTETTKSNLNTKLKKKSRDATTGILNIYIDQTTLNDIKRTLYLNIC
jgi:hypothetical protein